MIESQEQFENEIKKEGWCVTVLSEDTGRRNGVPVPEFVRLTGSDTVEKYIRIFTSGTHTAIVSSVGNFIFKTPLRTFAFGRDVNLEYWEEKCVSVDFNKGIRQFSQEAFEHHVKHLHHFNVISQYERDCLMELSPSDLHEAITLIEAEGLVLDEDFSSEDLMSYSYRYWFCCRALRFASQELYRRKNTTSIYE